MSAAGNFGAGPVRGRIALLAQIVTLAATGCFLWLAAAAARVYRLSPWSLLLEALAYAVLAWLWSGAITIGLYLVVPREDRGDLLDNAARTCTTAIWFAPATILLAHLSPGALVAALVLVVNASRLLFCEWRLGALPAEAPAPVALPAGGIFTRSLLPERPWLRELGPNLVAAFVAQAAAASAAMRYPLAAAGLAAMSASMLTVFALSRGVWTPGPPPTLPKAAQGLAATIVLATILTVGGLAPRVWHSRASGVDSGAKPGAGVADSMRAVLRELFPSGKASGSQSADRAEMPPEAAVGAVPGGFPGVILWPEVKPVTTLIAPLPAGKSPYFGTANPLSIPFGGEYWLYRWPFQRPPAGSYFQRGSPVSLSFGTTDRARLQMEASQKLDQAIDIRCCGEIRLDILNADRYPQTVLLELILIDRDSPGAPFQTLGFEPVLSTPDLDVDPPRPARETLRFRIPESPAIDQFDQLKVVFRRDRSRVDKSARIAIERFVLAPRSSAP